MFIERFMLENPLVSILMITYNHERFVVRAIESVLMQQVNFPYEIVIGEDCSTDRTRDIVIDYQKKYGDRIKLILQKRNIGGNKNFSQTYHACTGKYIAILEGDDYWTDPLKLQKQVDVLDKHPEYAGCAHQTWVVYEDHDKDPHVFQQGVPEVIERKDMLAGRIFHTASVLFRAYICKKHLLPTNITAGDRALFFLIVYYGKIYFLEDVMACYRKSSTGISSWVTATLLEKDLEIVKWIVKIDPRFPKYKYLSFIHYTIFAYPKRVTLSKLIKHFLPYVFYSFAEFPYNIKPLIRLIRYDLPDIFKRSLN